MLLSYFQVCIHMLYQIKPHFIIQQTSDLYHQIKSVTTDQMFIFIEDSNCTHISTPYKFHC